MLLYEVEPLTMTADLVYILGVGHSGSTLLDMVLGTHPACLSLGEMSFFDDWIVNNKACTCGKPIQKCKFWATVLARFAGDRPLGALPSTDVRRSSGVTGAELAGYLGLLVAHRVLGDRTLLRFLARGQSDRAVQVHRLYDIIREVGACPIVIDSSKGIVRLAALYSLHPASTRVIYLTRDVRGWFNSQLKRQAKYGPITAAQAARVWIRAHQSARALLRLLPRHAWHHLRYEELCRQPEKAIEGVCHWLGIGYTPAMLNYRDQAHHNIGGNPMRLAAEARIVEDTCWRETLSADQLQMLEAAVGELNRRVLGRWYVP